MSIKRKILTITLFVIGFVASLGIVYSAYALSTHYMIEMKDGVYLDYSEIRFNGDKETLENGERITSVTVTLNNESNKDFKDTRVVLVYYNDKYSHDGIDLLNIEGRSLKNKIIDVKANEKTVVTFTEFETGWYYNEKFTVAFQYEINETINLNSSGWVQLDIGNGFKNHYDTIFLLGVIISSLAFVVCNGAAIIIIAKNKKK